MNIPSLRDKKGIAGEKFF